MMEAFLHRSGRRSVREPRQQLMQRNMPFLLHVFASFR
jgi:hypothetical protein